MLLYNKYISISHRNQLNAQSYLKSVSSLINFECETYGISEVTEKLQEVGVVSPTTLEKCTGLGSRINKLVSSNFTFMMRSVSVIFYIGYK